MIKKIYKLKNALHEKVKIGREEGLSLAALRAVSAQVDETLLLCKEVLSQTSFGDESSEIEFFKVLKPEIISIKIEAIFSYNVKINEPVGTDDVIAKYYKQELQYISSFFRRNAFHYQYYKNQLTELDNHYFLRSGGHLTLPIDDVNDLDQDFSTPMSYLFGKFRAYEMVEDAILCRIRDPDKSTSSLVKTEQIMKWTGDSINVVELAYGIHLSGQINNGNASLNEIVRWLESILDVKIGIVQRRFSEIAKRKRLSQTKFIDQMRDRIIEKIDAGNE